MIREAQRSELPAILELWLESTTWGHPFIKSSYWRDCIPLVRDAYLANAQNWVWEEDGKLLGFVSIMEGRFLAAMQEEDVERLVQDAGIIRHRGKIQAIIGNARAYLQMEQNGEPFADFVWSFVNHQPQVTQATTLSEIPTSTPASDALSKALKKRGFKFVGTTICYSFMQACGLVNDHVVGCCCYPGNKP